MLVNQLKLCRGINSVYYEARGVVFGFVTIIFIDQLVASYAIQICQLIALDVALSENCIK